MPTVQTKEVIGDDVVIEYSTDGTTFTEFAKLFNITGFKVSVAEIDTTPLNADAETSQPGHPNWGEGGLEFIYSKALVTTILGWVTGKTILFFRMKVADGTTGSTGVVQGWVKDYDPFSTIKRNEKVTQKMVIKATGALTWTAGT